MTSAQRIIKICAIALAILLALGIIASLLSALFALAGWLDNDSITGEMKQYPLQETVTSLELELSAARLEILTGEELTVESNLLDLTVREKNGKLSVIEKKRPRFVNQTDAVVKLTLPETFVAEEVEITAGAGSVQIAALTAKTLEMELGAGQLEIDTLCVTESGSIEGGAGQITIRGGELSNLDFDLGVGEVSLACELLGTTKLECGIGEVSLTLPSLREAYSFTLEKGIGEITLNGESVSSNSYGTGDSKIEIAGGIGKIAIVCAAP